jgi:hypothetical protein
VQSELGTALYKILLFRNVELKWLNAARSRAANFFTSIIPGYNNYIIKNGFIEMATPALWTWLFFSSPKPKGYAYDVIPPLFPDHLPTFFLHGCRLAMAG